MKNKICLFIIAFLFVIICGCSANKKEGVAVTVYNNDILIADIKNEVENSKLVYEKNIEQINSLNNPDTLCQGYFLYYDCSCKNNLIKKENLKCKQQ